MQSWDWRNEEDWYRIAKDSWLYLMFVLFFIIGNEKYYSSMSVKEVVLQKERPKISSILCKYTYFTFRYFSTLDH